MSETFHQCGCMEVFYPCYILEGFHDWPPEKLLDRILFESEWIEPSLPEPFPIFYKPFIKFSAILRRWQILDSCRVFRIGFADQDVQIRSCVQGDRCVCFGAMIPYLYSDDDILIIDKPSGLAVQPGEGVKTCVLDVVERDYGFRPFLVHRLDKETAGCLALARSHRAASALSSRLELASKTYRAVVAGYLEPAAGTLADPVRAKGVMASARTRYRTLEVVNSFSLLEVELDTGRMHQIRQHLAGAGSPILGDDKHGDFRLNKHLAKELGIKRLMLYAWRLSLPMDGGGLLVVTASLPLHFADFFNKTGMTNPDTGKQDG